MYSHRDKAAGKIHNASRVGITRGKCEKIKLESWKHKFLGGTGREGHVRGENEISCAL